MIYRYATEMDYPALVDLWEKSVTATHHFLKAGDQELIKKELPQYFQQVKLKVWYQEDAPEKIIGFSGTHEEHLEMLFLAPVYFGQGLGTVILQSLLAEDQIKNVDVNQDNLAALKFYEKNGFQITSKSELDGMGKPYPLLHLTHISKKS